jgi:hypothetical protein
MRKKHNGSQSRFFVFFQACTGAGFGCCLVYERGAQILLFAVF